MGFFSKKSTPRPSDAPPPYSTTPQQQAPRPQQYAPSTPSAKSSNNPDTRPLPAGWISQFDPNSGRWFYVYTPEAHRQWEHPADNSNRGYNPPPPQQQQQPYAQQPYYPQQQQYIPQQQQGFNRGRMGGMGGMLPGLAMGGLGGLLLGDMMGSHQPDVVNNYYGDDYNNGYDGGGDYGGGDFGGGDFGGGDFGGGF